MPHTHTRPATHRYHSTELMTDVRGIHGFQGYCSCGWEGHIWKRLDKARAEAKWHFFNDHAVPDAERRLEDVHGE